MVNLIWVKERLIIFLLFLLIFLPPTFLLGGYTFHSLSLIETLILLAGLTWSSGRIKITKSMVNLPILFYMLSCLLSTINSNYLRGSWEELIKLACCIIFFLMIGNYLSTRLKLLVHSFIFTTLIVISFSLVYLFTHIPESLTDRLYCPLGNPNSLAGLLVITIPFMIRIVWIVRFRFLLGILLLFSFIILYFTYSRGGISGVIGAILFLFFITQRKRYIFILTACVLIATVVFITYQSVFLSRWTGLQTVFQRFYIWEHSWQMFLDHPILGVGLGAYPNVYFDYKGEFSWHQHSHNIFMQQACEVGIIGLLSFIWLLIALFRESFVSKLNNYEKVVKEGLLASLIGFLIHSQVDYFFWIPVFQLYFWLIMGILSSIRAKEYILLPNLCWSISIIIILFWSFCVLKPFLGYTSFNQGVTLADKGKWEKAKIEFERAVWFDFYHPIYHAHLGTTNTKIHPPDLSSAIKEYEKARQLDNHNPLFYKISYQKLPSKTIDLDKRNTLSWKLYRRMPMVRIGDFSSTL